MSRHALPAIGRWWLFSLSPTSLTTIFNERYFSWHLGVPTFCSILHIWSLQYMLIFRQSGHQNIVSRIFDCAICRHAIIYHFRQRHLLKMMQDGSIYVHDIMPSLNLYYGCATYRQMSEYFIKNTYRMRAMRTHILPIKEQLFSNY